MHSFKFHHLPLVTVRTQPAYLSWGTLGLRASCLFQNMWTCGRKLVGKIRKEIYMSLCKLLRCQTCKTGEGDQLHSAAKWPCLGEPQEGLNALWTNVSKNASSKGFLLSLLVPKTQQRHPCGPRFSQYWAWKWSQWREQRPSEMALTSTPRDSRSFPVLCGVSKNFSS